MTAAVRVIAVYQPWAEAPLELPVYTCRIPAGFPSPADDHLDGMLDLNKRYVAHPAATFFVYTEGDSMKDAGIQSGDMLIVDRSITPVHGKVVIACIDGELTVKRYVERGGRPYLVADNAAFSPIEISEGQEVTVWGVVVHSVHTL